MARQAQKTHKRAKQGVKKQYKIINWREYNQALVNRGNFTLWISEAVIRQWRHEHDDIKVGAPFVYSDRAIETLLALRELFRLTYRSTEGFAKSMLDLMNIVVLIPDFTTLAKRTKKLFVALNASKVQGAVSLVVGSTGLMERMTSGMFTIHWRSVTLYRSFHLVVMRRSGDTAIVSCLRDEAIRGIRRSGRSEWKRQVGYHRRSLAETAMYRMKSLFGSHLKNRSEDGQKTEARLRCKILNHFNKLGMPKVTDE